MGTEDPSFGKWVRAQRRSLDLSRQALADQAGCAEITLRRIESGTLKPSKELAGILLAKLGIPETQHAEWILFARGLAGYPAGPHETTPAKPQSNLPVFLTRFIGRDEEQTEVIELIGRHRLVTLTGSGGVGKTRLAAIVGEQIGSQYPDGVHMGELASLTDPELVPAVVAALFGLASRSNIPHAELLANFLRARTVLLILDNCEHLLPACAHLADALLKTCPGLRIVATSREPLQVAGEVVYHVPSLSIPDDQPFPGNTESESVRLFQERAQLARPDFALTGENVFSVLEICRRLDGIPLAIELAAARVDVFSVAQIAARLHESFGLLTGGSRTVLPRQQTIRGSMDWSWNLLSDMERSVLSRLSIFSGGWTLEAAEAVCSGNGIEPQQVAGLMAQLAAKSLVVVSRGAAGSRRYTLHEIIRQYAREKLTRSEETFARIEHLQYYLEFAKQAEGEIAGPRQLDWLARLNAEQDNLRSALDWAARTDLEGGLYLIGSLRETIDIGEGLHRASVFLEKPESRSYPHARAKALLAQAHCLWYTQQFDASRIAGEESLALFRACGDREGEFHSLMSLGSAYQFLEGMDRMWEYHGQALTLAQSLGDPLMQARVMNVLGWDRRDAERSIRYWDEAVSIYRRFGQWLDLGFLLGVYADALISDGEIEAAQPLLEEAFALNQQASDKRGMEFVLVARSRQALLAGELAQARAYLQEWLAIGEKIGNRMGYLWGRARLGYVALMEGSLEEGSRILYKTAREFHKDRNRVGLASTLEKLAYLFAITNLSERAARLLGWADKTRDETGDVRPRDEQAAVDRDIALCISRLGADAVASARDQGRHMTLDEAFALALQDA